MTVKMQETRQHILEILKETQQATVDEIVEHLRERRGDKITAVTVRHHLNELQKRNLITAPRLRHRDSPGRPKHVYALTDEANELFPNNYKRLAQGLLQQLENHLPPEGVNVIVEGLADSIAGEINVHGMPWEERLDMAVNHLNEHGYNASWEVKDSGYILHTRNCPYHEVAQGTESLCHMDMRLIASLLGVVPRRISHITQGEPSCAYLIPRPEQQD
jgi:predicted ArsR family transcriptional regulator